MRTRTLALAVAAIIGATHAASAQIAAAVVHAAGVSSSIPNIARATGAARNAAAAASAHVERMSAEPVDTQQGAQTQPQHARVPAIVRRGAASASPVTRDTAAGIAPSGANTHARAGSRTAAEGETETFRRESFAYDRGSRRDPFVSLMTTSDLRPLISDLRLVAVAFDADGANSVAVLRDVNSKEQYRVKLGQVLGRMRVARIQPKVVTFTIEEFGFSRQESVSLGDPSQARKK